jgi:endonuclease/exonuclease/phosphatase family metal-dependent hydrolase
MALQAADTRPVQFRALTWNLFHGRDDPPDRSLFTWRSRLLRTSERNASHVQVNRDLLPEFSRLIAGSDWDVCLLQECPPRFAAPLAAASGAEAHRVLTSRNSLPALRAAIARRSPDLIASNEGGSNLTLVRSASQLGGIVETDALTIRKRWPERRTMALVRTGSGVCVANLHASADRPHLSMPEMRLAAGAATDWAGDSPLLLGGDLNLRPGRNPEIFDELLHRFGLAGPTAPESIDHLLARGLDVVEPAAPWPPEDRELSEDGYALRLSDHAPVAATFVYRGFASGTGSEIVTAGV